MFLYNKKAPQVEGGNYTKNCVMWDIKHEISSPKSFEILIKTELKVDTDLEPRNLYNHVKMCLNVLKRLQ